jgi:hypothetical protein
MARIIRKDFTGGLQVHTTLVNLVSTNSAAATASTFASLSAPAVGARIIKWWIKQLTVGSGTGDITAYLVVSGGTASTRQISDAVVIDVDATSPHVTEGKGWAPGMYEIAATDVNKALDLLYTVTTTNTTAPTGFNIGVIWSM